MTNPVNIHQLRSLDQHNSGLQWTQSMASGGLRRSSSAEAEAAYALAGHIHELEEAIQATYAMDQLFFPLPNYWWLWVPGFYGFGFLWALREDHFEDRLTVWGWFLMVFGVFGGWVLATKFYREQRARAEKRRQRPLLREERKVVMVDLIAARDRCLEQALSLLMNDGSTL